MRLPVVGTAKYLAVLVSVAVASAGAVALYETATYTVPVPPPAVILAAGAYLTLTNESVTLDSTLYFFPFNTTSNGHLEGSWHTNGKFGWGVCIFVVPAKANQISGGCAFGNISPSDPNPASNEGVLNQTLAAGSWWFVLDPMSTQVFHVDKSIEVTYG